MKQTLLTILLLLSAYSVYCTHNRAGEITYEYISGYTFEFTITTYTYIPSLANRDQLQIDWGDNTISIAPLIERTVLPNDYYHNIYIAKHTFPGPGLYEILMEDPNRNLGVKNIPNSVNVIFSIKTTMLIGQFSGVNNTPVLLNPPIDKAAKGHIFIHNPAAYDPDGDSISYSLTVCTGANGNPIENYVLPNASDTLYVDDIKGDLVWWTPVDTGVYNIAMLVEEWRNGIKISRIARDMQIDVYNTDNNPPVNGFIQDYCVEAGDTIEINITSTDADGDPVELEMLGGPMEVQDSPATFEVNSSGSGYSTGTFHWITNCSHARYRPYDVILKAEDIVNDDISLVDISSFTIKVLHNAPEGLTLTPGTDVIQLNWDASDCGSPAGYNIYRRVDTAGFIPDSCENGVPETTGYKLINQVVGGTQNSYLDNDNGQMLVPGTNYCYMITAYYDDGAESFASEEVCTTLVAGTPPILKVSVEIHDETSGQIDLAWAVPIGIDTIDDGPYRYEILRQDPDESDFNVIETINTPDLLDTTYSDVNINTLIFPYLYSVKLYYEEDGEWNLLPNYETAASLYFDLQAAANRLTLNMQKRAPWLNYQYDIFRQDKSDLSFDMVGTTSEASYTDYNLTNNIEYTYRATSYGTRPLFSGNYYTVNHSHQNSGIPIDTIPPCPPALAVTSVCDSFYNQLTWLTPFEVCNDSDVVKYNIYYRTSTEGNFQLIDSLIGPDYNSYRHYSEESLAGCYLVTAIDSFNNESEADTSSIECVDNCIYYFLPNVFSPNNDGENDVYISDNLGGYVKEVDMKIFNRYGNLIYKTNDPDINWDGRIRNSGQLVVTGVYYYICDVYEQRITGTQIRTLTGFIHVFSGEDNIQYNE